MKSKHSKTEFNCGNLLHNKDRAKKRFLESMRLCGELRQYRSLLEKVAALEEKECSPELRFAVTDRAFEAEQHGRTLVKLALDCLNECRDTGKLYDLVKKGGLCLSNKRSIRKFLKDLKGEGKRAREEFGTPAGVIFAEAVELMESSDLEIRFSEKADRVIIGRRIPGLEDAENLHLAAKRQPGQMGRVSTDEFFNGRNDRMFVSSGQLFLPRDCHYQPKERLAGKKPVDVYAGVVGGLSMMKGLMYQHARRVSEIGPRGIRGHEPASVILGTFFVIGAVMLGYGLMNDNAAIVGFGLILMAGSVGTYLGGFEMVIGVAVW